MMLDHEYETMRQVEDAHWWYRALRSRVAEDLRKIGGGRGGMAILDAGCGTGGMLARLEREKRPDWSLSGVDLSPLAVEICRKRGLGRVVESDVSALPFQAGEFDAVLSLDVLYCGAVDESAALSECARVLRPGGTMLVNCAAFECLRGSHDTAVQGVRRYTPGGLRRLLESHGLNVVTVHCWNAWAFLPIVVWRQISRRTAAGPEGETRSDLFALPAFANRLLSAIASIDMALCRLFRFPLGTSVYAVATKGED